MLIVSQVMTLYDGWESRIEERSYQEELVRCVLEHYHYTAEDTMVTLYDTGEKITSAEFWKDSPEMDNTGETYWEDESNCGMFDINPVMSEYTPERTMDRYLGKVFYWYKDNKDRFVAWVNYMYMRKQTEGIRG